MEELFKSYTVSNTICTTVENEFQFRVQLLIKTLLYCNIANNGIWHISMYLEAKVKVGYSVHLWEEDLLFSVMLDCHAYAMVDGTRANKTEGKK